MSAAVPVFRQLTGYRALERSGGYVLWPAGAVGVMRRAVARKMHSTWESGPKPM